MRNLMIPSLVLLSAVSVLLAISIQAVDSSPSSPSSSSSSSSSSSKSPSSTATQSRSSAASVIGTIGSLVPGLITNVAPLMLLFGLGALMMPALGMGAMGLLRESRRSSNDQANTLASGFPAAFAQYARPLQTSPQDIYYFTKRSFPSLMSNINTAGLMNGFQEVLERVVRAIDNADKRYN